MITYIIANQGKGLIESIPINNIIKIGEDFNYSRITAVETALTTKLNKPTATGDFNTHPNIVAVDNAGNPAKVTAGGSNFISLLFSDNAKWFFPNQNAATYSYFRANSGNIAVQGNTAAANMQSMPGISYTSNTTTLGFQRGAPMFLRIDTYWKYIRKFSINTSVTGQRIFIGLTPNYVSAAPTNVSISTLTQVIGVCMQSSSSNIFLIHNDGTGTANLIDTGYTNDTNCYYLLTITKNINNSAFTFKLDKFSFTIGYISSFSYTANSDFPNQSLSPALWCVDSANTAAVTATDYGSYEEQKLPGI